MARWETASITEAYQSKCQDKLAIIPFEDRLVLVVADGAGGSGAGLAAAMQVVTEVSQLAMQYTGAIAWQSLLTQLDFQITDGETTAVIAELGASGICGASVGDSIAWVINGDDIQDLTCKQQRKPLLGTGQARPVCFTAPQLSGTLLLASDGFGNYTKRDKLPAVIAQAWFPTLAKDLLESVRLPSGALWDDVGIVVCRPRPQSKPRVKHYTID